MGIVSDVIMFIFDIFFNILGIAISIALVVAVGKIVLSIVGELLGYAWKTIHKPSFDKFQAKFKQRKVKK
jgi:hypothetical protein